MRVSESGSVTDEWFLPSNGVTSFQGFPAVGWTSDGSRGRTHQLFLRSSVIPRVMKFWSSPPLQSLAGAEDLIEEIHDLFDYVPSSRGVYSWC